MRSRMMSVPSFFILDGYYFIDTHITIIIEIKG